MLGIEKPYKIIHVSFIFILLPSLLPLLRVDAFLLTAVTACIKPCDTNNFPQSQKCTTILQLKIHNIYVMQKVVGHPPWQKCPKFGFICLSICLKFKTSGIISFFLILFQKVRHHKVRKAADPGFLKKSSNGLRGLLKSQKWPQKEVFRVLTKIVFIQMCFFTSV